MTLEIALILGILVVALILFVTEWLRMDLVALLVLSSLALLGLVSPAEAVSGFSNPAVITVWAMFIISEGLTRTGIAERIGRQVTRVAGRSELRMITIFMLVAGVMSAFMNNIGVAALLLPVAMVVARRGGVAPSRVLMPLAYGTLVGGMMTLI
ncbi:MAG: SLC13 family permease, partial [Thiobacillus sp.]